MAYLGVTPTTSSQSLVKQDFSVSATQNYTLSQSVTNANDIALYINNVRQEPTYAYSASGTSLTLTAATAGTDDMYCIYLGRAVGTINPASGSVGTSQLADGSVSLAKLSASGTKSSSTFLRGDNSFAAVGGSNVLEMLVGVCDGRSVTVPSGTYTMPNVTAFQSLTGSYADITGSSIAYTPPSGTTKVIYNLQAFFSRDGDYPLGHFKFFVDSDEASKFRKTLYGGTLIIPIDFRYIITIGGSADTANANVASWSSNKTLKITGREYTDGSGGSGNHGIMHKMVYWDGTSASGSGNGSTYIAPTLTITALKDT